MELAELSQSIEQKRKIAKLTQQQLSKLTNISTRTIASAENGFEVDVGICKIAKLLDTLGYELDIRPKGRPLTLDELNRGRQ
ncbi:MAG: helix-turn-helix domain-containing protein [Campylobacterales bacterium]|nr:helix-turn-helix domain-containing protein [Campylobacterales bacterium]